MVRLPTAGVVETASGIAKTSRVPPAGINATTTPRQFRLRFAPSIEILAPMSIPADLKYTTDHEWIRLEGDSVVVGITHHAQEELSDVVYVELPDEGRSVAAAEAVAVVESVKAASDIYSPVDGEITEANAALNDEPGLLNTDPYGAGWIFRVKLSDPAQLDGLLSAEDYQQQVG